jgi:hypothetical protein
MSATIPWYASALPYLLVSGADGQPRKRSLAKASTLNAAVALLVQGEFGPIENLGVELEDGSAEWCGTEVTTLFVDPSRPPALDRAKPFDSA